MSPFPDLWGGFRSLLLQDLFLKPENSNKRLIKDKRLTIPDFIIPVSSPVTTRFRWHRHRLFNYPDLRLLQSHPNKPFLIHLITLGRYFPWICLTAFHSHLVPVSCRSILSSRTKRCHDQEPSVPHLSAVYTVFR